MNTCRRFKTLSVAYEAASYLRYVAKIHLKHTRTSKWRRMASEDLQHALTRTRRSAIKSLGLKHSWLSVGPEHQFCGTLTLRSLSYLLRSPLP